MTLPFHYRHSGLHVASALELPEWHAFACDKGDGDVRIVLSDEACPECPSDGTVAVGETLRFAVEGIGGWQVEGGHTIRLHPGLTVHPAELRLFTLGSAWGALGYQRGFAMWHGSAVERGGGAVLVCGDTGAGKSTMAAALCRRGASLVADDLSRIEPGQTGAVLHPSSSRIKLWREAIAHFGWQDRILQRDYVREDKFHCSVPADHAGGSPVPLKAVVLLERDDDVRLERVEGGKAVEAVFRQTLYRPDTIEALGAWAAQGALAARIVSLCPVYRLLRPRDFAALDEACAAVESLWSRISE